MKLYESILMALKNAIQCGELQPGMRVPSVVTLRRRFAVSHITVLRAYQELAAAGLIEQHGAKIYYVKPQPGMAVTPLHFSGTIGCFLRTISPYRREDNYFNDILYGVQAECAARRINCTFHHATAPLNAMPVNNIVFDAIVEAVESCSDGVDGFLLDEHLPDDVVRRIMARTPKPLVLVNRVSALAVNSVVPPVFKSLEQALKIVARMGYGRFIYLQDRFCSDNRREAFRAFCAFCGAQQLSEKDWRIVGNCNWQPHRISIAEALEAWTVLREDAERVLVVSESDILARMLADELSVRQISVPQQIGILTLEGVGFCEMRSPHLAHVGCDAAGLGRLAVDVLLKHCGPDAPEPDVFMPEPEFALGESL